MKFFDEKHTGEYPYRAIGVIVPALDHYVCVGVFSRALSADRRPWYFAGGYLLGMARVLWFGIAWRRR